MIDGNTLSFRKRSFELWLEAADKTWNNVSKRIWEPKEGIAYCLPEGLNIKVISKIVEGADDNDEQQDAEQQLYCPRDILPPAWTSGKTLEDYIQGVMHIVFLGAGRTTIHLETYWLKAKCKGSALIKIVSPLVDSVQKLQLRWLPLQRYKESLGGYVSENVLACIRLMPWTYGNLELIAAEPPYQDKYQGRVTSVWKVADLKGWLNA